uniref:RRM domain-containing protein n=1 Tax=Ditylenchus dipsaci TaxID=166011 RepID=A0A915ENZ8_9BILA
MEEPKPNNTLYIKNLPEKLKKEDLKKTLAQLFSPFGAIVDILCSIIFECADRLTSSSRTFCQGKLESNCCFQGENFDRSNKIIGCEREEKSKKKKTTKILAQSFKKPKRASNAMEISLPAAAVKTEVAPPHKILYVTRIPPDYDPQLLRQLFLSFAGLRDVRLIEGRPDIAFVEFESEMHATVVKKQLNKYHIIPDHPLSVVYANK